LLEGLGDDSETGPPEGTLQPGTSKRPIGGVASVRGKVENRWKRRDTRQETERIYLSLKKWETVYKAKEDGQSQKPTLSVIVNTCRGWLFPF
jgi:hypothetical protein